MTRNWILGTSVMSDYGDTYETRMYGKLMILVDKSKGNIIDIHNRKVKPKSIFINPREKADLNKLLGLEE